MGWHQHHPRQRRLRNQIHCGGRAPEHHGGGGRLSHCYREETMILALQLSHFSAAALFALFFSIVFGITQRNSPNEMLRYGAYCFAVAMVGMFVAGWVMWMLHH